MDFLSAEILTALLTLTAMEIVLGIDNIVFIAILVAKVPRQDQEKIRRLGIALALIIRIGLLFSISWLMGLTKPFMHLGDHGISGRDLILFAGGLFLIAKATFEIHHKVEGEAAAATKGPKVVAANLILFQILLLDIVFSLDSVITAVGMVSQVWVMVVAMVLAMIVMLVSAKSIGDFVDRNPAVKILALSFLILIGVMLVAESLGNHVPKGYIYFAMAFSLGVELLNIRYRKKNY